MIRDHSYDITVKLTPLTDSFKEDKKMPACPKCKNELANDAKFCDACGAELSESVFYTEPGEPTSAPGEPAKEAEELPKSRSGKGISFAVIGIIAVIAIVLAFTMLSGGKKDNYCMYLKDSEIFYNDYTKGHTVQLTSRLTAGEKISNLDLSAASYSLGAFVALSDDGNRVFFPDRITKESDGVTLYYRDLNKPDQEAVKIDSGIKLYAIDGKGTRIVYLKGSDSILYLSDLSSKEKIASGVQSFNVNDNLRKIGYMNEENSYYIWYANGDSVKVASDITYIEHVAADLSKLYYIKDDALYRYLESSSDREKISSDISGIVFIYDSGKAYYTKGDYVEKPLIEFIEDDMLEYDAGMTEPEFPEFPEEPEYPYREDYATDEAYDAAWNKYLTDYTEYDVVCTEMSNAYDVAYEEFWDKVFRDYMREELENETKYMGEFSLYYFDGEKEHLITDKLFDNYDMTVSYENPATVIRIYGESDFPKIRLSEIEYYDEVIERLDADNYFDTERYLVVGTTLSPIEQKKAEAFTISPDCKSLYFISDISDNWMGNLYKTEIVDGKAGRPQLCDEDVSSMALFFNESDKLTYYKDVNYESYTGDLFIDGQAIDYDVRLWYFFDAGESVLYYTDWDYEKSQGTLKMFKGGTKTRIADDVHDFDVGKDNEILYIRDYSNNYNNGSLYRYNNGKPEKIADDVVELLWISEYRVRGDYNIW